MNVIREFNFDSYFPSLQEINNQKKLEKISTVIDTATQKALLDQINSIVKTEFIKDAVTTFTKGRRTCGGFDFDKGILEAV